VKDGDLGGWLLELETSKVVRFACAMFLFVIEAHIKTQISKQTQPNDKNIPSLDSPIRET
jgi:hypothetical protein